MLYHTAPFWKASSGSNEVVGRELSIVPSGDGRLRDRREPKSFIVNDFASPFSDTFLINADSK